jgi:uncharacterized membrane protein YdbT with pleckstrin-like domain
MGLAEKLLADGERPLVVLRPHVRRLVRPALVLLVLAPAAAFAAGAVPPGAARGPVRFVVTVLAALVAVRWVVWPFLLWWNTLYVLTDERFFERGGLVRRTAHDLRLQGVSDVVVAQRFGERLLHSGTLRVITDGGGEVVVTDVPAVSRVQRSLLAVADDIAERLRAPRRWAEEADDLADPRAGDDEVDDEVDDEEEPPPPQVPPVPDRAEARRREREARRRLGEIQDRMRRTPVPDSPLEEGGDDERTRPVDVRAPAAENEDPPGDEAGGARILRFPPRP